MNNNSLDLLRLMAASMVLYSHQYALLGLTEPSFLGWNTFGGVGVTIFFFMSGFLVWGSWQRDSHVVRFIFRRSLRIFPGLWAVCLLSVFVFGPLLSTLSARDYFESNITWTYLKNAVLVTRYTLPGLFPDNAMPFIVNGSLWTLPVEFICYITVAITGFGTLILRSSKGVIVALCVLLAVLLAQYGVRVTGVGYEPYFEMFAVFWWGVYYARYLQDSPNSHEILIVSTALLVFAFLGDRGTERLALLVFATGIVHIARNVAIGATLTARLGDISYGVYIFAFPVQQLVVYWSKLGQWPFSVCLGASLFLTLGLAYLSWHWVEKPALRIKPTAKGHQ